VLDVRNELAVDALFKKLDRLDALINCAGLADPGNEFSASGFARTVDINLTGTMRCCLAARALLTQSNGAVVNVASLYAIFGSAIAPGYSASKGGVVQLTKSLAVAWAPDVRVNAVAPGSTNTGLHAAAGMPDRVERLNPTIPMGRGAEPEEVAAAVMWLMSEDAGYITGAVLPVSGGR